MDYRKPLPDLDVWNRPFWESAHRKVLSMPACTACGHVFFPPGPVCPKCFSNSLEWRQLSGKGHVESWVVFHQLYYKGFAEDIPYNVAQIRLEEGPKLMSNIVEAANQDIYTNMPVEVVFEQATDDITIPKFKPLKEG